MFHKFESRQTVSKPTSSSSPRKVNRSCLECTRRKVRCDGGQPCNSCVYYKVEQECVYRQRTKRHAVSRSVLDHVSEKLRGRDKVLETLFPSITNIDHLIDKSRSELLDLIQTDLGSARSASSPRPVTNGLYDDTDGPDISGQVSENGEPVTDRYWTESMDQPGPAHASDDINAFTLATDQHHRSYLGVTSVSAILRTIFRLCPAARDHVAQQAKTWPDDTQNQPQSTLTVAEDDTGVNILKEQRCLEFYFEHVHPITGFLNEDEFRATYVAGNRQDPSWLSLLNMVLALGSLASGSDVLHDQYYKQARSFLDLDSLGSGNLETLQALCLLGGYYLHYRNAPNMAYAVMGAAHRMAIALGLHREPRTRKTAAAGLGTETSTTAGQLSRLEVCRRTWWAVFCVDTWACMTLGRPTCGRWEPSAMDIQLPAPVSADDHIGSAILASSQFCLICYRIQERFAQFNRLTVPEALAFDRELQEWRSALPSVLQSPANSPPRLIVAREFIRNMYLNIRLILSRSILLYLSYSKTARNDNLTVDEKRILASCHSAASEAIDSAALYWTPNRIHVWNSGWHLFQACMVPLLSLALESTSRRLPQETVAGPQEWRANLAKALSTFAEMKPWMRPSDRSPDIVSALYEAVTAESGTGLSGALEPGISGPTPSSSGNEAESLLFGWYDEQLTFPGEMDWSTFLMETDLPAGVFPDSMGL